jgi:hypothetical protein
MNFVKKKLVTIPDDKGVLIKIAGAKGERYVYKQIAYFRNEAGKPRNRTKIIGNSNYKLKLD